MHHFNHYARKHVIQINISNQHLANCMQPNNAKVSKATNGETITEKGNKELHQQLVGNTHSLTLS